MNIGVDIRVLGKGRAVSRYTRSIIGALGKVDPQLVFYLFTDETAKANLIDLPEERKVVVNSDQKIVLREHFLFRRKLNRFPIDVFFHPDNTEYIFCHPKSVVTIHDLIPWLYPDLILSNDSFIRFRQQLYLKLQEKALQDSARRIITVSQTSKLDLVKTLGLDTDIITVTYEGVDSNFKVINDLGRLTEVKTRYGLPENFIFYIGGLDERKNVRRLLHAFSKIASGREIFLVIGGRTDFPETEGKNSFLALRKEVEALGISSLVRFTGYIPDEDLPEVYNLSRLFVYPSFYEGFGLPPLEAMACGVPVVASKAPSVAEVCGTAALLVDPYETEGFISAIDILLRDEALRQEYREKGQIQSKRFDWEDCALKTLEVLKSL